MNHTSRATDHVVAFPYNLIPKVAMGFLAIQLLVYVASGHYDIGCLALNAVVTILTEPCLT
jgi:hypothetical protein